MEFLEESKKKLYTDKTLKAKSSAKIGYKRVISAK